MPQSIEPLDGISVLGAGSFGSALALHLANAGHRVVLWGRDALHVASIARERVNPRYLGDARFPDTVLVTDSLPSALTQRNEVLVCVPSHAFRELLESLHRLRPDLPAITWATKGFEPASGRLLGDVVQEVFGGDIRRAVMSGPSFAREVALGLPTAVALAGDDARYAQAMASTFSTASFRVYVNDDLTGVQVCGGVKNVLAIASGIADGLGFGANARAALVTRGLAELTRLGVALGGRPHTFTGLAGLGDLLLTCTDDQSRNRRFGLALARGESSEAAARALDQVVEGAANTREVNRLAARVGVEMPISRQVERVLFEALAPEAAVTELMTRALRSEVD